MTKEEFEEARAERLGKMEQDWVRELCADFEADALRLAKCKGISLRAARAELYAEALNEGPLDIE
jgi:hypothetical protein